MFEIKARSERVLFFFDDLLFQNDDLPPKSVDLVSKKMSYCQKNNDLAPEKLICRLKMMVYGLKTVV